MIKNNNNELRSCVTYTTQPRNLREKNRNSTRNYNATPSLKALAVMALRRNQERNSSAAMGEKPRN